MNNIEKFGYQHDGNDIICYKSVRSNMRSIFDPKIEYMIGEIYKTKCDRDINNEDSYGFGCWTFEGALQYAIKMNITDCIILKVCIENGKFVILNNGKIRAEEIKIIEKCDIENMVLKNNIKHMHDIVRHSSFTIEMLKYFVENNYNFYDINNFGNTTIHYLYVSNYFTEYMFDILNKYNYDMNIKNKFNETPNDYLLFQLILKKSIKNIIVKKLKI